MLLGFHWLTGKPGLGKTRRPRFPTLPSLRTAGFHVIAGNHRVRILILLSQRIMSSKDPA